MGRSIRHASTASAKGLVTFRFVIDDLHTPSCRGESSDRIYCAIYSVTSIRNRISAVKGLGKSGCSEGRGQDAQRGLHVEEPREVGDLSLQGGIDLRREHVERLYQHLQAVPLARALPRPH